MGNMMKLSKANEMPVFYIDKQSSCEITELISITLTFKQINYLLDCLNDYRDDGSDKLQKLIADIEYQINS
jgi:hypothetical protein